MSIVSRAYQIEGENIDSGPDSNDLRLGQGGITQDTRSEQGRCCNCPVTISDALTCINKETYYPIEWQRINQLDDLLQILRVETQTSWIQISPFFLSATTQSHMKP